MGIRTNSQGSKLKECLLQTGPHPLLGTSTINGRITKIRVINRTGQHLNLSYLLLIIIRLRIIIQKNWQIMKWWICWAKFREQWSIRFILNFGSARQKCSKNKIMWFFEFENRMRLKWRHIAAQNNTDRFINIKKIAKLKISLFYNLRLYFNWKCFKFIQYIPIIYVWNCNLFNFRFYKYEGIRKIIIMAFFVLKTLFIRIINYNKNRIVFKMYYLFRTYHIYLLNFLLSADKWIECEKIYYL